MTTRATPTAVTDPLIPSGAVRPLLDGLERLGYDRARLLAAAGLRAEALADPDAKLPCATQERLVAQAQQERPRANLALDLAAVTPIGAYPLIDYLALSSGSVGEGLARVARYYRLIGAGGSLELRDRDDPIQARFGDAPPFWAEYGIALPLFHLGRESGGRARATGIHFTHRPGDAKAFEKALGCPVHVGTPWSGFTMTRETWRLPMRRRDPILVQVLERHADEILERMPAAEDLIAQVRQILARGLAPGESAIATVARSLVLTPRTLQRRLAGAGTTFQRVLEEIRREAAIRHLQHSELSIAEIAFVLGYSEPAAFHRAFRRWHGATPRTYRARLTARGSG